MEKLSGDHTGPSVPGRWGAELWPADDRRTLSPTHKVTQVCRAGAHPSMHTWVHTLGTCMHSHMAHNRAHTHAFSTLQ